MVDIATWLASRLEADSRLGDDEKLLILAALEGEEALADLVGFSNAARSAPASTDREPVGAYIKQIQVEGFRGIGPSAQLDLKPGPGLTIVSGRNGSGKSSFAEALELALTGTTYRWRDKRSTQWGDNWRNLHEPTKARIEVSLVEESSGMTNVLVDWAVGADRDDAKVWLQRQGQKREAGTEGLGWDSPLVTYRPLLTYEELGALLSAEPSKLHDALASVLGMQDVADAVNRLEVRSKELAQPGITLSAERASVLETLRALDDERAQEAVKLLLAKELDAQRIRALVTGTVHDPTGVEAQLRAILNLQLPSANELATAVGGVRTAVQALADASSGVADVVEQKTLLLREAIAMHAREGDMVCPVCSTGQLDHAWLSSAKAQIDRASETLGRLTTARAALNSARTRTAALVPTTPAALETAPVPELADYFAETRVAWDALALRPAKDLELVSHLESKHPEATIALEMLHHATREVLASRDDAWASAAAKLAAHVNAAESWDALKSESIASKSALKWLKENDVALKNERLLPIAQRARDIWAKLRQESNVEIAGLTLAGTATRRHVEISAAVDGKDAAGLSVMSQGELHALALALFLPRATMPESPFRFVVLDDPVQAMDPAKIDGLVDVLTQVAMDRQVVVFSHDDRLAHAVRRAAIDATVLEVTREANSRVSITDAFDPPMRYLSDARAMVRDAGLPDATLRRVLPGMLRFALEAQAREIYYSDALSTGRTHADIDRTWTETHKTSPRVQLALYGKAQSLDGWLNKESYRRRGLGICTSAAHTGLAGSPIAAIEDVEKMVRDIRLRVK